MNRRQDFRPLGLACRLVADQEHIADVGEQRRARGLLVGRRVGDGSKMRLVRGGPGGGVAVRIVPVGGNKLSETPAW